MQIDYSSNPAIQAIGGNFKFKVAIDGEHVTWPAGMGNVATTSKSMSGGYTARTRGARVQKLQYWRETTRERGVGRPHACRVSLCGERPKPRMSVAETSPDILKRVGEHAAALSTDGELNLLHSPQMVNSISCMACIRDQNLDVLFTTAKRGAAKGRGA